MSFPIDILPQLTDRLILRQFTDVDIDSFFAYRNDFEVARYQSWSTLSRKEAQAFIDEMKNAMIGIPGEWFQVAIAERQSNLLLGDIGFHVYKENTSTVEIGFTLDRSKQGQGYALEALQAFIYLLFDVTDTNKIIGITDARNQPSIRLLRRLGMQLVQSDEVEFKGELCIEHTFEMTKENRVISLH
ncbi:hypothetical protein AMR41_19445 [Hapalosiphon sp. MRB220]|nr:hypothetical protein AMR41_19445 [Hapalosiphon sp. MRB220]